MVTTYIDYTSGNIASSSQHPLVTNIKPNYKYKITEFSLSHVNESGGISGLNDGITGTVDYTGQTSFTAPTDNVSVDMELVRDLSTNSVHAIYTNFTYENYNNYNYSFYIKAYTNPERTTVTRNGPQFFTSDSTEEKQFTGLTNLTTTKYYFQMNTFKNSTAGNADVRTDSINPLKIDVHDVRGLAYMRDYDLSNIDELDPISSVNTPHDAKTQSEVRLSADGNRMVMLEYQESDNKIKIRRFVMSKNQWSEKPVNHTYNLSYNSLKPLHRYPNQSLETANFYTYSDIAFSEYGDKYVFSNGNQLTIIDFETDDKVDSYINESLLSNYNTNTPVTIHCLTISADGKRILASGNHATGVQNGDSLDGPAGGTAMVYYSEDGTWAQPNGYIKEGYLSSEKITNFSSTMYYGSDSAISGDGKTAVIWGKENGTNTGSEGFIWKYNDVGTNTKWIHIATLKPTDFTDFKTTRHRTPCAISHDGKTIVVCSSKANRAFVYTSVDYEIWNFTNLGTGNFNTCDISGDGKTAIFVNKNNSINVYSSSDWSIPANMISLDTTPNAYRSCALSFDASTICTTTEYENKLHTVRIDKKVSISEIYDYFNKYSRYVFVDYDAITQADWTSNITEIPINTNSKAAGHSDAMSITADGKTVLMGIPASNQSRLYTDTTYTSFSGGHKCSMDDTGTWLVTSTSNGTLKVYKFDSTTAQATLTGFTSGQNPWALKMSKNGKTVIAIADKEQTTIYKWTTTGDWSGYVPSTTLPTPSDVNNPIRVTSIDLNYDGTVVVGAGFNGGAHSLDTDGGYVVVFDNGTVFKKIIAVPSPAHYVGQSVAISSHTHTDGSYRIVVGEPRQYNAVVQSVAVASFLTYNSSSRTLTLYSRREYTGLYSTRYGRSVAMDSKGYYAVLSGNREDQSDANDYTDGGVVVVEFNSSNKTYTQSINDLTPITGGSVSGKTYNDSWFGIGHQCKITSDGKTVAISGGGYARLYSTSD